MTTVYIPITRQIDRWLDRCEPKDAHSLLLLMLAMTTNGRTPSPSILRSAIPPTVELTGLVSAGIVVMDDHTATMPHLLKLADKREKTRVRVAKHRITKGVTSALQERYQSVTHPTPLSPPHTPPLTPIPHFENNYAPASETTYDKPKDPAAVAVFGEIEKLLGRECDGREMEAVAARVVDAKAIGDIECDGATVPAWKVYAECIAHSRDAMNIRGGAKALANYAFKVLESCQREKLGPGKRAKSAYKPETVRPIDNTLEQRISDRLARRNGGVK